MSGLFEERRARKAKPPWLRVSLPHGRDYDKVRRVVRQMHLNTVCEEARCPNIGDCWSRGTATFIILGAHCTRDCRFCAVPKGQPSFLDPEEPGRLARAVHALGLGHAVITSVTRDDLADGGAAVFAATIREIRQHSPDCTVEVLVPDFQGNAAARRCVLDARPDVFGHNLETVPRLYPDVRPQAAYQQSLQLLEDAAGEAGSILTKSGLMLGLGESDREVRAVLQDLADVGCRILTLGQYCCPGKGHIAEARFVAPEVFAKLRREALALGIRHVEAGPLVRSSYRAEIAVSACTNRAFIPQ